MIEIPGTDILTVEQARDMIGSAVARQIDAAQRSEYDWKVCLRAVSAADAVFRSIPVEGDARSYMNRVLAHLSALRDRYDDPDGEYTNGSSDIGSLVIAIDAIARSILR